MRLAATGHAGQIDKAGAPYLLHPLRLMMRMDDEDSMIVPILHDYVEDTPATLNDLRKAGFRETVVSAVDAVTRRDGESYEDFCQWAGRTRSLGRLRWRTSKII